jgi:hypothetical protein
MAYFPIELPPGVYRSGTELQSSGRFYDADLVRWRNGALEPIGGWYNSADWGTVDGVARAIRVWTDNDGNAQGAIGTHKHLYAIDRALITYDITPIRATTTPTDPFDTTSGSAIVTVTDAAHGALVGDTVIVSGATAVGGLTLNGPYEVLTKTTNTFTVNAGANASSTANGGGTVTLDYQIHPGVADSDSVGGYGNEPYGTGLYGIARGVSVTPHDVTVWSLDTFGENLNACQADDGVIYEWSLSTGSPAVAVANAPTARALVVTNERILMALGANGNPRGLAWSNQEDNTDWTPSATTYAGDFILQTSGKLMCGRRVRGGTLLLTTVDAWLAEFLGQPFVYGFEQKGGAGTGVIAQGAVATMDGEAVPANAVWMGQQGFFAYNGYVQPLVCEVAGLVFADINRAQISKVSAWHNADFGEVTWFYPSASSKENDRYVTWNYRDDWWTIGQSGIRTCGTEKGPLNEPLAVDVDGKPYKHEYGLDHGGSEPFAESGPFHIKEGAKVIQVTKIIPDEHILGDVEMTVFTRFQPKGEEFVEGPFTLSDETDCRFQAREMRVRYTGTRLAPWRVGHFRLDGITDEPAMNLPKLSTGLVNAGSDQGPDRVLPAGRGGRQTGPQEGSADRDGAGLDHPDRYRDR